MRGNMSAANLRPAAAMGLGAAAFFLGESSYAK
jgi:hypothetical protein